MLGFNVEIDDSGLFPNFQSIRRTLLDFVDIGGIEMDPIVDGEKVQFTLKIKILVCCQLLYKLTCNLMVRESFISI